MDGRVTNSRRCLEYLGRGVDASASVHIAPTCCGCPNCPHAVSAECAAAPPHAALSLIPTVNGNTVRSFSTHGHQSATNGSSRDHCLTL